MTAVRLVIFDWAGTTVDFGSIAPVTAFIQVFAGRGLTVTEAEARKPMGTHKKDHLRLMLQMPAIAARWQAATGRVWTEADVEEMYRTVTPMQLAGAIERSHLTPGLADCVLALRRMGVKIGGGTGYFREAADAVAREAKQRGYAPDFNICADDVSAGRPAPWMVFRCMEALDVYPPAAVMKVGDTVADIEEGLNAGVRSVAVVDSSSEMGLTREAFEALSPTERSSRRAAVREKFRSAGADIVIDSLADLVSSLANME